MLRGRQVRSMQRLVREMRTWGVSDFGHVYENSVMVRPSEFMAVYLLVVTDK